MELHKLKADDVRGFDAAKLRETEKDIRKALVDIRMDIYSPRTQHAAKLRGLKKSLARLLTVAHQAPKAQAAAKPAATAAKPAAKKKAAPKTKTK